jgi:hypothetical protein
VHELGSRARTVYRCSMHPRCFVSLHYAASRSVDATVLKLISADAVVELPSAQPGAFFTHIAA